MQNIMKNNQSLHRRLVGKPRGIVCNGGNRKATLVVACVLGLGLLGTLGGCQSGSDKTASFSGTMQGWMDKLTGHDKKPLTYEAAQLFNSDHPDAQRRAIAYISFASSVLKSVVSLCRCVVVVKSPSPVYLRCLL